ncbi:CaiB/BaiF CoA-transferase family protein [Pseudarthrobacter sp. GA104]|uniref:CaiB/BaiF CoA transferase family protein n=1 Tax=Pseudarthrobacter sp. GA104 TaxID=2676311 RepID=UPI0012FC2EC0|nr:CoA transferase [Pseudarthrobacter sp. GA104]MUU71496.1 CoA transferase [Pseudarthrobacter sp. GA104]
MSVLDNIRVLDISQGAAGPTAATILGDHGAKITKIEPQNGEWGRTLGPPFWHDGTAVAAVPMNRNKRSLALDLRRPDAQALVRDMIGKSDVLVESFRPGVMARFGLDYEAARQINPQLIYCSITAFGPSGPRRDEPGVDGIAQAIGGLMSITGVENGERVKVGVPVADMSAALQAVQGILLALLARGDIGRGQHVEVSLFDSLLALQMIPLSMYMHTGTVPTPKGSGAAYSTPNETYRTSDGAIMVAAYTPERWPKFCRTIGRPELVDDPRFATNSERLAHRSELRENIERATISDTTSSWLAKLQASDLMCAPVVEYDQLVMDPQIQANDMIIPLQHPKGVVKTVGIPIKLSETPGAVQGPAPLVGENSREILRENGHSDVEIDSLIRNGAVIDTAETLSTT